eukprot:TRINITY_DN6200_c0_g3_i1.p1 TRINITY_DN6200_c0_g3~~TRINITY_DN6200_c0_g3_i1.p1  ORF type:complete len:262 (+),score=28.54 TRINITY_DN6200_c0_g3_i1:22-786(+)
MCVLCSYTGKACFQSPALFQVAKFQRDSIVRSQQQSLQMAPVDIKEYNGRWENLWQEGVAPGEKWDRTVVSPALEDVLNGKLDVQNKRVVVPGCGRGYDVIAFSQAGAVQAIGLEITQLAVDQAVKYRDSLGLPPSVSSSAQFQFVDFFVYQDAGFDVGYDYTFLCAIHPDLREQWSKTWFQLIKPGGELVTLIYPNDPARNPGPPWYVNPEEVRKLLIAAGFECEYLEDVPSNLSFPDRVGHEALGRWRKPVV